MINPLLQIRLDATSIWATVEAPPYAIGEIECSLIGMISQGVLGSLDISNMRPWFLTPALIEGSNDKLTLLAGLLPYIMPNEDWPKVLDMDLSKDFAQLLSYGWRSYQVDAISAALEAPLGRGIVEVGTGGGKTRIAWGIATAAGGDWIYVVHGRDLVRQAGESFQEFNKDYTPASIRAVGWNDKTILSQDYYGIIVDECHQAAAPTRAHTLSKFSGGWRIGLSGTPLDRSDDRNTLTIGFFGPVCYEAGVHELTGDGFLTPGKVVIVPFGG
jgi:superfamily II DNA or RNA helicase